MGLPVRLRDYQNEIFDDVLESKTNDLVQLDTGAGKTPIEAALFANAAHAMIVAHRNVLIVQCSAVCARFGVAHDTVSSEFTRRRCMVSHKSTGRNFIDRGQKRKVVASIDSIVSHYKRGQLNIDRNACWLILIDEAHHVVPDNKWGMLREIYPNARFVGFTATPGRPDGASLSVRNGGLFDRLVQCSWLKVDSTKKLIASGMLSGFELYTPPVILNAIKSRVTVEIAEHPVSAYQRYMPGMQAIVMCPAIKNAKEIADEFKAAGVSAASISSDMSGTDVWRIIAAFSAGHIKVLCNVDMVGEGFDVPGVVGLIIARATKSFVMYRQWIGRILRTAKNKKNAIIVDLVGAVSDHGLPDDSIIWDIDNPPKTPKRLVQAPCDECGFWHPIRDRICPNCGYEGDPGGLGSHYIEMLKLDHGLIAHAKRESAKRAEDDFLKKELYITKRIIGPESISRMIDKIREEFAKSLAVNLSIYEVNCFFRDNEKIREISFWTKNFSHKNTCGVDEKMAMRIYKKCLK